MVAKKLVYETFNKVVHHKPMFVWFAPCAHLHQGLCCCHLDWVGQQA